MAECQRRYDYYDDPCGTCDACRANEAHEMSWEQRRRSEEQGTQLDRIEAMLTDLLDRLPNPPGATPNE